MSEDQRVNILLVDDQPAKLLTYESILSELGENLIKANSAQEALEHLLKNDITIILIDVVMPDLDGFELATMIRSHPRFQSTAIIFVSAVAMTDFDRLRGYEHGAVDYVPVPVVPEILRAKVRVFAELYRKTRQLEHLNADLEKRVAERTAQLAEANADLERRVEERTQEREIALAQVHEMQKLESLGKLTGGLAHDFNNLLMVIKTSLDLLAKRLPPDPRYSRLIEGAQLSTQRGATLTSRMLAFARRQELKPQPVDVRQLVDGMVEMLQRTLGAPVRIVTRFAHPLAQVRADPGQLELAILNLALNARDAMPNGGELTISAGEESVQQSHRDLGAGSYIVLRVADTGSGMDSSILARAADPFFTTKGIGKGTGLGLSMVHGLAAQLGGALRIQSEVEKGTTVAVWLPVVPAAMAALPVESQAPDDARPRGARVLVVDDDPLVGHLTSELLTELGYEPLTALSGAEALELLSRETVNAILTDHAMPGMTGLELAHRVRAAHPELPVVIATGYAELAPGDDPGLPRLTKPYDEQALDRMLSEILGREASAKVIQFRREKDIA
jgi:signal transduction histidine kinase